MDIAQVRQKFPQYSDLSDEQLAKGLHQKYYSDVPYEKFAADIGLKAVPAEKEPTWRDAAMKAAQIGFLGGAARVIPAINEALDKSAYDVGGAVTDKLAGMGASPGVAAGAGYAANVGLQSIPVLAGNMVGRAAAPVMEDAAKGLMQSALKPTIKDLRTGRAERAVQTMLDEGVNATKGGVEKLSAKVEDLSDAVAAALKGSGATVDKGVVASRVQDVISKIEKNNPTPQEARAAVETVYNQFMSNGLVPSKIPVEQANRLKSGIYQALKEKYGALGSDTIEAQKALARGLKEEIAAAVPGVAGNTAKQSELINAMNVAERRALMDANKNPLGLAALAHDPAGFAAFLADKSALFKSIVARMLYSGKETIPGAVGATGVGVYNAATQPNPDFPDRRALR